MRNSRFLLPSAGFFVSLLLIFVLGLFFWVSGVKAFSPGSLTSVGKPDQTIDGYTSHADFEAKCGYCHQPFGSDQGVLCLDCHQTVKTQVEDQDGLHGSIPDVMNCRDCHTDHAGKDADTAAIARDLYDHSLSSFSLVRHQVDYQAKLISCEECHAGSNFEVVESRCTLCHSAQNESFMDQHISDFGEGCLNCHDGRDKMTNFDHDTTQFPLTGRHFNIRCLDCHQSGNLEAIDTACSSCHEEPELHRGSFDLNCAECHSTVTWSPATLNGTPFQHDTSTSFSLTLHTVDYAGTILQCQTCHPISVDQSTTESCRTCHAQADPAFMQDHEDLFGPACVDCHDGVDRMHGFDHDQLFPVDGRHAEITCEDCHVNKSFQGTPSACSECHQEPDLHKGFFGDSCEYCHGTTAWVPAPLQRHIFPLDHGGQGEVECSTCHTDTYAEFTCYGCHEHQPDAIVRSHRELNLSELELAQCETCHPVGVISR